MKSMRSTLFILPFLLLEILTAAAVPPAAPTFQELMDPSAFPNAQRGLEVESVEEDASTFRIRTTGANIILDLASGTIAFHQRIGHERPLSVVHLGIPLQGGQITHRGPGMARMSFEHPAISIRVNGDSLFMLHVHEPMSVPVERKIAPAWQASFKNNHLIADEWGAFGLYTSMNSAADRYSPYDAVAAVYPLNADDVLWVGVCPPKPYDWERSFRDNVVWHWSNTLGYPDDAALLRWRAEGNIVLLQSEVMLWKDWNVGFVPRPGMEEFARVRNTVHGLGARFIVYTSPYYFLRGTALEPAALNSFEGFTNWPPGTPTGENMGLFLEAIRKVMTEYRPDGLYFDGQYTDNPAALYALARSAREIVGEAGILEWHSTFALGPEQCYLPQADAYVDYILRGESEARLYEDLDYLRFFVSGYNVNNCFGVLCNNGPAVPTPALVERVLSVNARFHTIAGWLDNPEIMDVLRNQYRARLIPELRISVEENIDARQAAAASTAAVRSAEMAALKAPPSWTTHAVSHVFTELPGAEAFVSPMNTTAFSIVDGTLQITAHAHTYAYYRFPQAQALDGFVVKLRQGTDGGMSWGPAALLRWPDETAIRVGLRSDGLLQADLAGRQLLGGSHASAGWVWVRARWLERSGVIESSTDGEHFERVWSFEHAGAFTRTPSELLVGKVPYSGRPADHIEPGPTGACEVAFIETYPAVLPVR